MKTLKFNSRYKKGRGKGLGNSKILNTDSILLIILMKRKTEKLLKKSMWLKRETAHSHG